MEKPELLQDIDEYLESIDNELPISIAGLEQMVGAVVAQTKLDEVQSKIVIRLFFQEMRNLLLRKNKIDIRGLGSLYVSSPFVSNNSKKVFVKFKPKQSLIDKLND